MALDIRNCTDANGTRIQPYYAAYMIEHGFATPRQAMEATSRHGTNEHYLFWNQDRWAEFERETDRPHDGPRQAYAAEFTDWLQERVSNTAMLREAAE